MESLRFLPLMDLSSGVFCCYSNMHNGEMKANKPFFFIMLHSPRFLDFQVFIFYNFLKETSTEQIKTGGGFHGKNHAFL